MSEEATAPEILVEHTDGVALITLNRPDRLNALIPSMMGLLAETVAVAGWSRVSTGCAASWKPPACCMKWASRR